MKKALIVALVLGLGIVGVLLGLRTAGTATVVRSPRTGGGEGDLGQAPPENEKLAAELGRLRAEVRALQAAATLAGTSTERDHADKPTTTDPPAADAERPELSRDDHNAAVFVALDSRVESEQADRGWAIAAEREIEGAFARGLAPGTRMRAAKCASTLCRVLVSHTTAEDKRNLAQLIGSTHPFSNGVYYAPGEDEGSSTLYVLRGEDTSSP